MITKDTVSFTLSFEGSSLIQYGDSSYSYNEAHIRIKKETPTQTTYYTLEGQNIIHTKVVTASLVEDTYYLYDELGVLVGYTYNDNTYYYERDVLGNIIRIIDKDLKIIVEYKYDAFGNFTKELYTEVVNAITIEQQNHFYYKGYCFDEETGLYYCNSRYYDPSIGRWISPDDISYLDYTVIGGSNLYVYCGNNPVMYYDSNGTSSQWLQTLGWVGLAVGAVLVIGAITVLTAGVGTATLAGAIAVGAAKGALIGAAIGVGVGATAGAVGSLISGEEFGSTEFWSNTLFGAMAGFGVGALIVAVAGGVAGYVGYTPTKITGFTRHGMNQIISRDRHGVANKAILETMRAPNKVASQGLMRTSFKYAGKNAVVVLNKTGKVITAYAKSRAGWRVGLALWLGYEYL